MSEHELKLLGKRIVYILLCFNMEVGKPEGSGLTLQPYYMRLACFSKYFEKAYGTEREELGPGMSSELLD